MNDTLRASGRASSTIFGQEEAATDDQGAKMTRQTIDPDLSIVESVAIMEGADFVRKRGGETNEKSGLCVSHDPHACQS